MVNLPVCLISLMGMVSPLGLTEMGQGGSWLEGPARTSGGVDRVKEELHWTRKRSAPCCCVVHPHSFKARRVVSAQVVNPLL